MLRNVWQKKSPYVLYRSEKSDRKKVKIFIGEREKWTNKGTDKQYLAVFVTQYNSSLSSFVPNFRVLSQVVAEKSFNRKKVYKQTDRQTYKQTNIITEKAKTISPLYTWYRGYKIPTLYLCIVYEETPVA